MWNPVDRLTWAYEEWFVGHALRGYVVVSVVSCIVLSAVLALLWARAVDNYAKSHPKVDAVTTIENLIAQRNEIVARCKALFAEKTFVIRTNRDDASLRYLFLIFEHHRGIIMLAPGCRSPAFSLIRPMTEAFNRLHVAMYGTDKQFQALPARVNEFETSVHGI